MTYEFEVKQSTLVNDVRLKVGYEQTDRSFFELIKKDALPFVRGGSKAQI